MTNSPKNKSEDRLAELLSTNWQESDEEFDNFILSREILMLRKVLGSIVNRPGAPKIPWENLPDGIENYNEGKFVV